jgi:hypothetical protein
MGVGLVFFDDLGENHYVRSSRNTFEHFRGNWYSEGRILPDGVNHAFKSFLSNFDNVRHKWYQIILLSHKGDTQQFRTEDPQILGTTVKQINTRGDMAPKICAPLV